MAKSRYRRVTCSSRGWVAQVPGLAYQVCQTEELAAAVAAKALGVSVKSLLRMVSWCRRPSTSVIYHRPCACVGARRAFVHIPLRTAAPAPKTKHKYIHWYPGRQCWISQTPADGWQKRYFPTQRAAVPLTKTLPSFWFLLEGGRGAEAPHTSTYLIYHDPPSHNRRTDHLARSSCRCRRRRGAAVAAAAVAAVTADEHDAVDDHNAAAVTAVDDHVETYIV